MKLAGLLGYFSLITLAITSSIAEAQSSTEAYSYDALGRLISVVTAGGQNNAETHSICYDDAGNRTQYVSDTSGIPASCTGGTPPPPPPPPANNPPVTVNDTSSGGCDMIKTVNLTANDTDPEGNYPLTLVSISRVSGAYASADVVSASSVSVDFGPVDGTTTFSYTVTDSLNASSAGTLTTTTSGGSCGF